MDGMRRCERRDDKRAASAPPEIPPAASSPAPPAPHMGKAAKRSALEVAERSEASPSRLCASSGAHDAHCENDPGRGRASAARVQLGGRLSLSSRSTLLSAWPAEAGVSRGGERLATLSPRGTRHLSWGFLPDIDASTTKLGPPPLPPARTSPRARQPTRCHPGFRRCPGVLASSGYGSNGVGHGHPVPPSPRLGRGRRYGRSPRRSRPVVLPARHPRAASRSLEQPFDVSCPRGLIPPREVLRRSLPPGWPRGPRANPSTAPNEGLRRHHVARGADLRRGQKPGQRHRHGKNAEVSQATVATRDFRWDGDRRRATDRHSPPVPHR